MPPSHAASAAIASLCTLLALGVSTARYGYSGSPHPGDAVHHVPYDTCSTAGSCSSDGAPSGPHHVMLRRDSGGGAGSVPHANGAAVGRPHSRLGVPAGGGGALGSAGVLGGGGGGGGGGGHVAGTSPGGGRLACGGMPTSVSMGNMSARAPSRAGFKLVVRGGNGEGGAAGRGQQYGT